MVVPLLVEPLVLYHKHGLGGGEAYSALVGVGLAVAVGGEIERIFGIVFSLAGLEATLLPLDVFHVTVEATSESVHK